VNGDNWYGRKGSADCFGEQASKQYRTAVPSGAAFREEIPFIPYLTVYPKKYTI
jgi:hypothetical protein